MNPRPHFDDDDDLSLEEAQEEALRSFDGEMPDPFEEVLGG